MHNDGFEAEETGKIVGKTSVFFISGVSKKISGKVIKYRTKF